jgi:hypothetical protein
MFDLALFLGTLVETGAMMLLPNRWKTPRITPDPAS